MIIIKMISFLARVWAKKKKTRTSIREVHDAWRIYKYLKREKKYISSSPSHLTHIQMKHNFHILLSYEKQFHLELH